MAQDAEEQRWERQIAVSGQTPGQRVSCRIWMSLPAMPALVPIKRKTSVTQCGGEEDEEPEEARGDALLHLALRPETAQLVGAGDCVEGRELEVVRREPEPEAAGWRFLPQRCMPRRRGEAALICSRMSGWPVALRLLGGSECMPTRSTCSPIHGLFHLRGGRRPLQLNQQRSHIAVEDRRLDQLQGQLRAARLPRAPRSGPRCAASAAARLTFAASPSEGSRLNATCASNCSRGKVLEGEQAHGLLMQLVHGGLPMLGGRLEDSCGDGAQRTPGVQPVGHQQKHQRGGMGRRPRREWSGLAPALRDSSCPSQALPRREPAHGPRTTTAGSASSA